MAKEIATLIHRKYFDFKFKTSMEYQYVRIHLVYAVKIDLIPKARLVCDGNQVDSHVLSTRATVVKGVLVQLLDIIADSQNINELTVNIGNFFIQAHTKHFLQKRRS